MDYILQILPAVAVLIAVTNIVAEVVKNMFSKAPAQVVVVVVAIVLTVVSVITYCILKEIPLQWYYYVGSVVGGLLVAYGAMYGYDNLYDKIIKAVKKDE